MGSIAIFSVNVNSIGDYMKWKDVHDYSRKDSYRMSLFITRNARRVTNRFVLVLHGVMIPVSLELKRAKLEKPLFLTAIKKLKETFLAVNV